MTDSPEAITFSSLIVPALVALTTTVLVELLKPWLASWHQERVEFQNFTDTSLNRLLEISHEAVHLSYDYWLMSADELGEKRHRLENRISAIDFEINRLVAELFYCDSKIQNAITPKCDGFSRSLTGRNYGTAQRAADPGHLQNIERAYREFVFESRIQRLKLRRSRWAKRRAKRALAS